MHGQNEGWVSISIPLHEFEFEVLQGACRASLNFKTYSF